MYQGTVFKTATPALILTLATFSIGCPDKKLEKQKKDEAETSLYLQEFAKKTEDLKRISPCGTDSEGREVFLFNFTDPSNTTGIWEPALSENERISKAKEIFLSSFIQYNKTTKVSILFVKVVTTEQVCNVNQQSGYALLITTPIEFNPQNEDSQNREF